MISLCCKVCAKDVMKITKAIQGGKIMGCEKCEEFHEDGDFHNDCLCDCHGEKNEENDYRS